MIKTFMAYAMLFLLFAAGCGEKKADPAKVDEAAKLIANKDFEKGIALIDDLGKSSPSDELVKKEQVDAHMKYANFLMYESTLPPKEKYPSALRQYRLVVSIDPTNSEAKENVNLIEGIYNQMGRPIPE
jgi:hypothetical protein